MASENWAWWRRPHDRAAAAGRIAAHQIGSGSAGGAGDTDVWAIILAAPFTGAGLSGRAAASR